MGGNIIANWRKDSFKRDLLRLKKLAETRIVFLSCNERWYCGGDPGYWGEIGGV